MCIDLSPSPVGLMRGYQNDDGSFAPLGTYAYHTGAYRPARSTDGYHTYIGRADDVFKASDYRISPFELESALIEHPAVVEAAVVPAPDAIRLAVPKAYVTLTAGSTPDRSTALSIFQHLRQTLAPFKRVRRLEFTELPKNNCRQDQARGTAPAGGSARKAGSAWGRGVSGGGFSGAEICVSNGPRRGRPVNGPEPAICWRHRRTGARDLPNLRMARNVDRRHAFPIRPDFYRRRTAASRRPCRTGAGSCGR